MAANAASYAYSTIQRLTWLRPTLWSPGKCPAAWHRGQAGRAVPALALEVARYVCSLQGGE